MEPKYCKALKYNFLTIIATYRKLIITTLLLGHSRLACLFGTFFDIGGAIPKFVVYYDTCPTLPQEEVMQGGRNEQGVYAYVRLIL